MTDHNYPGEVVHLPSNYSSATQNDQHYPLELPLLGVGGEIADQLYANSIYPDKGAAELAALAAIAAVAGHNNFSPTGLKLNLYTGFVMPSGSGKERLKNGVLSALEIAGLDHRIVSPAASRQALHGELNALEVSEIIRQRQWIGDDLEEKAEEIIRDGQGIPTTAVMVADEFHSILLVDEKSPHKKERRDMLLQAYTETGLLRPIMSRASPMPPITQLHFNMIGFSTPGEMIQALGNNSAGSGLAGRFIFYTMQARPKKNYENLKNKPLSLTAQHSKQLRQIAAKEQREIPWSQPALNYWMQLDQGSIEPLKDEEEGAEIANRIGEQVIVIASLMALCRDAVSPEIDPLDIDRAWRARYALHMNFINMLRNEGGLGASVEATIAIKIEKRLFKATRAKGSISRSRFSQSCAEFRKLTKFEQDNILQRLAFEGKLYITETPWGQSIQWCEKPEDT